MCSHAQLVEWIGTLAGASGHLARRCQCGRAAKCSSEPLRHHSDLKFTCFGQPTSLIAWSVNPDRQASSRAEEAEAIRNPFVRLPNRWQNRWQNRIDSDLLRRSTVSNRTSRDPPETGFYKILPANTADHLCQSWQLCSNHHEVQTVYYVVKNPHMIRLREK